MLSRPVVPPSVRRQSTGKPYPLSIRKDMLGATAGYSTALEALSVEHELQKLSELVPKASQLRNFLSWPTSGVRKYYVQLVVDI